MNSLNYWTPLTSQVEELERKVTFKLPSDYRITNGKQWRRDESKRRKSRRRAEKHNYYYERMYGKKHDNHKEVDCKAWKLYNINQQKKREEKSLTVKQIKEGMMNGTIPAACSDTGATSTAGKESDPFQSTDQPSNKIFVLPTGGLAPATKKASLLINVRAPANEVDIVPGIQQTLLSTGKFANAGYTAV